MPATATLTTEACRRRSPSLSPPFSASLSVCAQLSYPQANQPAGSWGSALCQCLLFAHKYNDTCELAAATPPPSPTATGLPPGAALCV